MIDLTSSNITGNLEATFEEQQKFNRRSLFDEFKYFNGVRQAIGGNTAPCVLKTTSSTGIVNSDKWKLDVETADHLSKNCNSKQFLLDYFNWRNDSNQYSVVHEWFDFTLDQYLVSKGQKLPEESALYIYYQVVLAIGYLEEIGVIHRDINPANVAIILDDGQPTIKLFNYCNSLIDNLGSDVVGSDVEYLAPIMIENSELQQKKLYNSCVDYWSATVMLYRMLIGRSPFDIERAVDSKLDHIHKFSGQKLPFPVTHKISYQTVELLKRLLAAEDCSKLDREYILDDPVFAKYGAEHRTPMIQPVSNRYENTSILFNSLRMSRIPGISQLHTSTQDFANRLNTLINNRKQRIEFINKGVDLLSKHFNAFAGEDKTVFEDHLVSVIGLIVMLRGMRVVMKA